MEYTNINAITGIFNPFGEQKVKRCSWCYSLIYGGNKQFCSRDCREEHFDFLAIIETRRNNERSRAKYHSLTPEQKKIHNRKIVLRRNPNAPERSNYKSSIKIK